MITLPVGLNISTSLHSLTPVRGILGAHDLVSVLVRGEMSRDGWNDNVVNRSLSQYFLSPDLALAPHSRQH